MQHSIYVSNKSMLSFLPCNFMSALQCAYCVAVMPNIFYGALANRCLPHPGGNASKRVCCVFACELELDMTNAIYRMPSVKCTRALFGSMRRAPHQFCSATIAQYVCVRMTLTQL